MTSPDDENQDVELQQQQQQQLESVDDVPPSKEDEVSREPSNNHTSKNTSMTNGEKRSNNGSNGTTTTTTTSHATHASFLASMTFASSSQNLRLCDCDDCGDIPLDILAAIREHKRLKLETGPLKRTQDRSLLQRDANLGISIWNFIMPLDAEPLIEFGSSHRFVWMKRLPTTSSGNNTVIKSIGKGIIGSSDEESSRTNLDWEEGGVYLVPSNGGKAVGWVHTTNTTTNPTTSTEETTTKDQATEAGGTTTTAAGAAAGAENLESTHSVDGGGGPAVLNVIKIPLSCLEDIATTTAATTTDQSTKISNGDNGGNSDWGGGDDEAGSSSWGSVVVDICVKALADMGQDGQSASFMKLCESESLKLKEALKQMDK